MKHLTDTEVQRLSRMSQTGVALPDVAKEFGASKRQILQWCLKYGIKDPVMPVTIYSKLLEDKDAITKAFIEDCDSARIIAKRYSGAKPSDVLSALQRWGITRKAAQLEHKTQQHKQTCEMIEAGYTHRQIATKLKITMSQVQTAVILYDPIKPTRKNEFLESREAIGRLVDAGMTYKEISQRYMLNAVWVSNQIKEWGWKRAWEDVQNSIETCRVEELKSSITDQGVDEAFFVPRRSNAHQVVIHWREYERLKKLAGEEI